MKQIYSVFTYYQLITAIQIKNKLFPEADADIVISDHSAGYEKAAEKVRESGIFDNVYTESVDLILSQDQKVMTGSDVEGWRSDESSADYEDSADHRRKRFLGKTFKSIKCGRTKY